MFAFSFPCVPANVTPCFRGSVFPHVHGTQGELGMVCMGQKEEKPWTSVNEERAYELW